MEQVIFAGLDVRPADLLPTARLLDGAAIETATGQWEYALLIPVEGAPASDTTLVAEVEVQVLAGRVSVCLLNRAATVFVAETSFDAGPASVAVLRGKGDDVSTLVFRNASAEGASRFQVCNARITAVRSRPKPYPVALTPLSWRREADAADAERDSIFDDDAAADLNRARLDFIRALDLRLNGRRVLDVGAGVGHFARWYADSGAQVVAVEGRAETVRRLRERHPDVEGPT